MTYKKTVPFFLPCLSERESDYARQAIQNKTIGGDGPFTKKAQQLIKQQIGGGDVLLTHSCTAALEMAAILLDIRPGDEFILPSYTFVSTANAFVLRGAKPVFVDIRLDTLNIDESLVEAAITERTKAIVVVHYAGVCCEMAAIKSIAERYGIPVVEDAAQAYMAYYHGSAAGRLGDVSAFSFHETKNIVSGEGGALVINDATLTERAEIIREKGTDRTRFFRGAVDKYTWQDVGSSYLPSDLIAAVLLAQLEAGADIIEERIRVWNEYYRLLRPFADELSLVLPQVPEYCEHNGHIFHLLVRNVETRAGLISHLKAKGIAASFHYVPLHSSPAGVRYAEKEFYLPVTDRVADTIVRLPLFAGMTKDDVRFVVDSVLRFFERPSSTGLA